MTRSSRAMAGLIALFPRGLAARIVGLSLLLMLVVQVAGFAVVRHSIDQNARAQLAGELRIGERVWLRLIETNAQRLAQGAGLLAADYGFRAAAGSGDDATIVSALENHGARIGATVGALLDTSFQPRALHARTATPLTDTLALHDIAERLARQSGGTGIVILDGAPHQFIVVPLRAPVIIGWVMLGFPLGQALVEDMQALSGLQVALLAEPSSAVPELAASTLDGADGTALLGLHLAPESELELSGETFFARTLVQQADGGALRVVLMRSVLAAVEPYRQLQVLLAIITLAGLTLFAPGSAWTAHLVTSPLRELARASERLGRGDYGVTLPDEQRRDEIGDLARAYAHMRSNIAANETEMRRLAYTDRLTGLPNRTRFLDAVQESIASTDSPKLAVLVLDLDRFKHVNDALGYALGDQLLLAVADRLARDVLRAGDLVARLGGDEFALLLPDASVDDALGVARRITASFERPLTLDGQPLDLSAGIGIACRDKPCDSDVLGDGAEADALLVHAEVAMYAAKRRNEAALIYDPAMDGDGGKTLSLLSELRQAVDAGELRLFLQPKIELANHGLVGAEALIRWQHPQRGLVPPVAFIPFAEQTGFVRHLTLWIFEQAARHWHVLQEQGPLRISVNLSTRDLVDQDLPHKLGVILRKHGVPERGFCLEITESAIMDDPARAEATLNMLSARGFSLSIDDFGTGYSSLAYLRRLPVDELKIDRSFVMAMAHGECDAKIVRSTIDLAHNLGLSVVAEGIEDAAAFARLAAMHCDEGQGYHMARPMPVAEFSEWAQRWRSQYQTSNPAALQLAAEAA